MLFCGGCLSSIKVYWFRETLIGIFARGFSLDSRLWGLIGGGFSGVLFGCCVYLSKDVEARVLGCY